MGIKLNEHFDGATRQRGRDYARRGLVVSVAPVADGVLEGRVSNGRGKTYQQRIGLDRRLIDGICSCPVGYNCKHVVAVLTIWAERQGDRPHLAMPVQGWLSQIRETAVTAQLPEARPEDYPDNVKDRLLYVLSDSGANLKIDICKGRINAAGTRLNKSIRRYDALHVLRSDAPAKFIRLMDLELLGALAQTRLWDTHYSYSLPSLIRPKGEDVTGLIRRLCASGRFLHDAAPDAHLAWSDRRPDPRLGWRMTANGKQRLGFEDAAGQPLELCGLDGATLWVDTVEGEIGALEQAVAMDALRLVESAPEVAPHETAALAEALPGTLAGVPLPRPCMVRQSRRAAKQRSARLTLGAEAAHDGPHYWGGSVQLPTLTLDFLYDGQETGEDDGDPRLIEEGEIVTLSRDHDWESACARALMAAGALPVEELEAHWPGERMLECDFAFADGELNLETFELTDRRDALDFAFRTLPELRREGWQVIETRKWPYRLSEEAAALTVATQSEAGAAFQGNDWFSLGFQAEIGGKSVDVAPLIAAFLEQAREDWGEVPDVETLAQHLADKPVYLDRGKQGYVALDLSPLAPLLHLFLTHHGELGALHPSDATVAKLAEEALAGSAIRFADNAGSCPWRAACRPWPRRKVLSRPRV